MTTWPAPDGRDAWRIGGSPRRVEDVRFLTGCGRYVDDHRRDGAAHLVLLRSPHAHARILSVDASAARAMPGVLAALTAEDEAREGFGTFSNRIRRQRADGSPMFEPPRHLLARGTVRHVGEAVAAIIATSEAAARDATERIDITYEALPAVTDPSLAAQPGAPAIWSEQPDNRAFVFRAGDAEAVARGFAAAAHVVRGRFAIPRLAGCAMETRACLAEHDPGTGRYTLTVGAQTPHTLRQEIAQNILRIPTARLRVISPDVGGAFGLKGGDFPEYGLALWAARVTGRPVRWRATRTESFVADHQARDNVWEAELALDDEGNFLAMRARSWAALGASLAYAGTHQATNNLGGLAGPYRTPAIHVEATGVFTNAPPVAPYRGAGRPEATFVMERLADLAAEALGQDRIAIRLRNMAPPEAMPFRTGLVFSYDSGDFPGLTQAALAAADWEGFPRRRVASEARGLRRGIGFAFGIEIAGGPPEAPFEEHAAASLDATGSLVLRLGTHSHGQGHETAFRQIAAEELGVPPDAIAFVQGDTDAVAHGRGTFGSRSISTGGTALLGALHAIRDKARDIAAHALEVAPGDLEFRDGGFQIAGTDRGMRLAEVAALAYRPPALPPGMEPGLVAAVTRAPAGPTFPNSAHVCEVELDPETGELRVVAYLVADDAGRLINPMLAHGQTQGGVAQGLGEALMERVAFDASGQILSASFQDYALPRAGDLPDIETVSRGVPTAANPLGAKGVGEGGAVGAHAALVNAVAHALGRQVRLDMPLTAEAVWRALCFAPQEMEEAR
jgi:carbon-monoxide dehydrogenase large subunit